MKIKYYRLTKENKKNARNDFYNTDKGKNLKKYTNISLILNIVIIIFAIYYIIDTYINKANVFYYIYGAILILISIIFLFTIRKIRVKAINNYIIKSKKY